MTKIIPLTRDQHTIVDDEDYDWLSRWKWSYASVGYAVRAGRVRDGEKSGSAFLMHRVILGLEPGNPLTGDHINANRLDNRRCNLRICTLSQNKKNMPGKNLTSAYKGVCWHKYARKWRATICVDNKRQHLGLFNDELDAALAYDHAARLYHGEFARTNF